MYKIVHGLISVSSLDFFQFDGSSRTRGHRFKVKLNYTRLDIRKHWFSSRAIPLGMIYLQSVSTVPPLEPLRVYCKIICYLEVLDDFFYFLAYLCIFWGHQWSSYRWRAIQAFLFLYISSSCLVSVFNHLVFYLSYFTTYSSIIIFHFFSFCVCLLELVSFAFLCFIAVVPYIT